MGRTYLFCKDWGQDLIKKIGGKFTMSKMGHSIYEPREQLMTCAGAAAYFSRNNNGGINLYLRRFRFHYD